MNDATSEGKTGSPHSGVAAAAFFPRGTVPQAMPSLDRFALLERVDQVPHLNFLNSATTCLEVDVLRTAEQPP